MGAVARDRLPLVLDACLDGTTCSEVNGNARFGSLAFYSEHVGSSA